MELFDQLLAIIAGLDRSTATRQLMAAGYTEDEVRGAWNFRPIRRIHRVNRVGNGSVNACREGSGSDRGSVTTLPRCRRPRDFVGEFQGQHSRTGQGGLRLPVTTSHLKPGASSLLGGRIQELALVH